MGPLSNTKTHQLTTTDLTTICDQRLNNEHFLRTTFIRMTTNLTFSFSSRSLHLAHRNKPLPKIDQMQKDPPQLSRHKAKTTEVDLSLDAYEKFRLGLNLTKVP